MEAEVGIELGYMALQAAALSQLLKSYRFATRTTLDGILLRAVVVGEERHMPP